MNTLTRDELRAMAPPWAKAVILANEIEDRSDLMTDYFGHTCKRTVAIGWRKSSRESFPALRKAAATFEPTSHMGPGKDRWTVDAIWNHDSSNVEAKALSFIQHSETYWEGHRCPFVFCQGDKAPMFDNETELDSWIRKHPAPAGTDYRKRCESFEHRECYSMGHGNYLKDGHRDSTGWEVVSRNLENLYNCDTFEDHLPNGRDRESTPSTASMEKVTISNNPKLNGVEIRFPDVPPEGIRDRLKSAGWRWSRRARCWYRRASDVARASAVEIVSAFERSEP